MRYVQTIKYLLLLLLLWFLEGYEGSTLCVSATLPKQMN